MLVLAAGAPLPRRLAYVVDRRAIVDQTVVFIRTWIGGIAVIQPIARRVHDLAAFPARAPVTIAVLRFADDGEWRTEPAVVIGTVDIPK